MYELRSACFIAFVALFFGSGTCQTIILQGNNGVLLGNSYTFTANSTSYINSTQFDWYFGSVKLTSNGLSLTSAKYSTSYTNNNTLFALTVFSVALSDYGTYSLVYSNLPIGVFTFSTNLVQLTTTTSKFKII
jgi:hypothetical protein